MNLDDEVHAARDDQAMIEPSMDTHDPTTYDPTQGQGTEGWQRAKRLQAELNARLEGNAQFRRN